MSQNKKQLKKIAGELKKASRMHASQAKRVEKISNSPLYMKSGMGRPANGSPINLGWGAVAKGLGYLGVGGLTAYDYSKDKTPGRSKTEKLLRSLDSNLLFGLGSTIYDNREKIQKALREDEMDIE